jgi:hypothetical protein
MDRLEMLLPFCSKPNHPIMDVIEKLHGDIYGLLMPNAGHQARRRAGARHERTLFAVACMPWFGLGTTLFLGTTERL